MTVIGLHHRTWTLYWDCTRVGLASDNVPYVRFKPASPARHVDLLSRLAQDADRPELVVSRLQEFVRRQHCQLAELPVQERLQRGRHRTRVAVCPPEWLRDDVVDHSEPQQVGCGHPQGPGG